MDANLLTDILLEKEEEKDQSLMEMYRENWRNGITAETIERSRETVNELKSADAKDVYLIVANFIAGAATSGFGSSIETMLMAIDAERNPENISDIITRIESFIAVSEKALEKEKLFAVTKSSERSLDYLQDFFGDDLIDVLMKISGAKKPTVSRWFKTGKMNNRSRRKVSQITAIFYQMEQNLLWDREKIVKWFYAPISGSNSPLSLFENHYNYYCPVDLRRHLEELNITWNNHY